MSSLKGRKPEACTSLVAQWNGGPTTRRSTLIVSTGGSLLTSLKHCQSVALHDKFQRLALQLNSLDDRPARSSCWAALFDRMESFRPPCRLAWRATART